MSLKLNHITKAYNSILAVYDINCDFKKARTSVLIGPSGCGKSTLLRLIVGLVVPDSGTIEIENNLLSASNLASVRKNLGYVIQDGGLFPHLTASENISLMAVHLGWTSKKISERIEELALLTKFPADGLNRFPAELSGGQKQRVSLMRALMPDPEFLLLDEPLGALDPLIRYELQEDLKEIFSTLEKTVVLVTHDLNESVFFADEIFLMRDGKMLQSGKLDDFINSPIDPFVTKFINAQRSRLTNNGEEL